ncbi:MAG: NYN domain-containing protein [bacterium]
MEKTIVFVDGENFRNFTKRIIESEGLSYKDFDYESIDLRGLISDIFKSNRKIKIDEIRYYVAKIHYFSESKSYSNKKIANQRKLKMTLQKQKVKFIVSGNVRRRQISVGGKTQYVFSEKGVDVGLAVDMVVCSIDKLADNIILCSSDSDLQPAVKESRKRGIHITYLGFGLNPNKGLQVTTSETILFRNQEIINAIPKKILKKPLRELSK